MPALKDLTTNNSTGKLTNDDQFQAIKLNIKQEVNSNLVMSSIDKENCVDLSLNDIPTSTETENTTTKVTSDSSIIDIKEEVSSNKTENNTIENGSTKLSSEPKTDQTNEDSKTVSEINSQVEIKSGVLPGTPLVKNSSIQLCQTKVKNSPNVSLQVTNEMVEEEERYKKEEEKQMEKVKAEALNELERTGKEERYHRLQNLLSKSQTYSTYLLGRITERREKEKKVAEREDKKKQNEELRKKKKEDKQINLGESNLREIRGRQVKVIEESQDLNNVLKKKKRKSEAEDNGKRAKKVKSEKKTEYNETFEDAETTDEVLSQPEDNVRMVNGEKVPDEQPKLLVGGVMRQYQVEGMEWMMGLYENGINGILADEMGLGKTLQSIALITNLIQHKVIGPFMIAAPLSTLPNWVAEFKRFAPQVYTILYHGHKDKRAEMRRKMMRIKKYSNGLCSLPVVITSYEIVMRDRVALSSFNVEWKYLIVDEGHRLKNLNCKLIKELKLYDTGNRLLLTGTPLQNNLAELWSLLNFLLPDIFDDLTSFQRWFDFSAMSTSDFMADEQETNVLQTLHSILTPFLLRRLKTDVDLSIPPKKEVLVRCPMTVQQQNYYKTTLDRSVLDMIAKKNDVEEVQEYTESGRPKRKSTGSVNYHLDEVDEEEDYFDSDVFFKLVEAEEKRRNDKEEQRNKKKDRKAIVNIKLQNIMMMLRKCCNHPYLLEYPFDSKTNQLIIDERLLNCSGKLLMMDKMLEGLKKRGHKVLIFSQMTLMLDIIVDYLDMKKWSYSRLDGTMKIEDRFKNIEKFSSDPETFVFLLSTRAGGLGLNLMMADTCIIYDSDWNPQVDLQAQDRCHRIGQKKPVIIYRLVTANTIDQRIIERAAKKRKLEKMVIHEKKFKGRAESNGITPAELLRLLDSSDVAETLGTDNVITDEELNELLDRSDLEEIMRKKKSKKTENDDKCDDAVVKKLENGDNFDENDSQTSSLSSQTTSKLFTVVETIIDEQVAI